MSDWKMRYGDEEKEETRELLCLDLGCGCLGIELEDILEIIREWRITPLPNVPEYYEGVFNWKGLILPLVSLEKLAGVTAEEQEGPAGGEAPHAVAAAVKAGEYECGFLSPREPRLVSVRESERLQGSIPELFGGDIVIKSAYVLKQQVICVIDAAATLENLVIYV